LNIVNDYACGWYLLLLFTYTLCDILLFVGVYVITMKNGNFLLCLQGMFGDTQINMPLILT